MLFDRMVSIVEAHLHEYESFVRSAKLFEFPEKPHEILPKEFQDNIEWIQDNFILPFRAIAVEDQASCVLLADFYKKQKGLWTPRLFIECMSIVADSSAFADGKDHPFNSNAEHLHKSGFAIVIVGHIENMMIHSPHNYTGEGAVHKSLFANKHEILFEDFHDEDEVDLSTGTLQFKGTLSSFYGGKEYFVKPDSGGIRGPIRNAYSAIQEIIYFNQPDKFILEETPLKKRKSRDKIPRSDARPKYTILRPGEIRKRMGLPQVAIGAKEPHERRRHDRWLSDKRFSRDEDGKDREVKIIPYGKRKGEPYYLHVDVPAHWVGPTENKKGNKHYKVLVNK